MLPPPPPPLYLPPTVPAPSPTPLVGAAGGGGAGQAGGGGWKGRIGVLPQPDYRKTCKWHLCKGHDWESCVVRLGTDEEAAYLRSFDNEADWFKARPDMEAALSAMKYPQRKRLTAVMNAVRAARASRVDH